eukprot:3204703-Heterocapsa_arctica.AAC.1
MYAKFGASCSMVQPTSRRLRNNYRGVSLVVKAALSEQLCSFSVDTGLIPVLSSLYTRWFDPLVQ